MMQGGGVPVLTVNTKREIGKKAQAGNIAAGKVSGKCETAVQRTKRLSRTVEQAALSSWQLQARQGGWMHTRTRRMRCLQIKTCRITAASLQRSI